MTIASSLSTTFNFLAALYERNQDVYNSVYLPIVGHAFAKYANAGHTMGTLESIQDVLHEEFGLVVPILLVEKLARSFEKSLSRRERSESGFIINKDKSFSFNSGAFLTRILAFEDYHQNAQALQSGFEEFSRANGEKTEVSFSDFLNEYKNRLSSFFGKSSNTIHSEDYELSFSTHIKYLQYIETNNTVLYQIAEDIYLGAIIAGYLESGQSEFGGQAKSVIYYFDTRLVLALLDLQEEYETGPVRDLIQLIQSQSGRVQVMDATIDEVRLNIQKAIDRFSPDKPNSTINDACLRQSMGKMDLRSKLYQVETILKHDYQIEVVPMPKDVLDKALSSPRLERLQSTRSNKKNALHDIALSEIVASRRSGNKYDYHKANYWFVTSNDALCRFNRAEHEDQTVPEIVSIEEITSILFFRCPQRDIAKLSSVGLRQVISQTLSYELPSRDLLSEFDSQVKKNTDISYDQYVDVCMEVARYSARRVDELIHQSFYEKDKFNTNIHAILQNASKKEETDRQLQIEVQESLNNRLNEITQSLNRVNQRFKRLKCSAISLFFFVVIGIVFSLFGATFGNALKALFICISSLGCICSFITLMISLFKE